MDKLKLSKNDILSKGIKSILDEYFKQNNVDEKTILKIQLICEEFLTNILFPNFDGDVEFLIFKQTSDLIMSFSYLGPNYMDKINDDTFLALKLIKNNTKNIDIITKDNTTNVRFLI